MGEPALFSGVSGGEPAEIRVYDNALLVVGAAGSELISFSFAGPVRSRDYTVTVEVAGREPVILSRLGRRTGELADLLTERLRQARGRTAAFLGSLLPGLDPMALREAAGRLRDGVAVPAAALDAMMAAGPFGFGEGYGAFGPYWAFRALGTGMNAREQHPMTPRPDGAGGLAAVNRRSTTPGSARRPCPPRPGSRTARSGRTGSPPCWRTSPQIVVPEILTEEYEPRG